jgi:hypothetical protein
LKIENIVINPVRTTVKNLVGNLAATIWNYDEKLVGECALENVLRALVGISVGTLVGTTITGGITTSAESMSKILRDGKIPQP